MSRVSSKSTSSIRQRNRRGAEADADANPQPKPRRKAAAAAREPDADPGPSAAPKQAVVDAAAPVRKRDNARPKRPIADEVPAAKPVRDRFSMPAEDFDLIKLLKQRAAAAGRPTRKSELLRAGLHALRESGTVELIKSLDRLRPVRRRREIE